MTTALLRLDPRENFVRFASAAGAGKLAALSREIVFLVVFGLGRELDTLLLILTPWALASAILSSIAPPYVLRASASLGRRLAVRRFVLRAALVAGVVCGVGIILAIVRGSGVLLAIGAAASLVPFAWQLAAGYIDQAQSGSGRVLMLPVATPVMSAIAAAMGAGYGGIGVAMALGSVGDFLVVRPRRELSGSPTASAPPPSFTRLALANLVGVAGGFVDRAGAGIAPGVVSAFAVANRTVFGLVQVATAAWRGPLAAAAANGRSHWFTRRLALTLALTSVVAATVVATMASLVDASARIGLLPLAFALYATAVPAAVAFTLGDNILSASGNESSVLAIRASMTGFTLTIGLAAAGLSSAVLLGIAIPFSAAFGVLLNERVRKREGS